MINTNVNHKNNKIRRRYINKTMKAVNTINAAPPGFN